MKMTMRHPTTYTFLGFYFNSLVDRGEFLDLKETHSKLREKNLFVWLKEKFGGDIDISLFSTAELEAIESFFESLSSTMDEERKMGVSKNGLCLLVGYCLEAAQRKEADMPYN